MLNNNYVKQWTKTAIECYQRGCVCKGCPMSNLETPCRMKGSVIELVRKFGAPQDKVKKIDERILEEQEEIIRLVINGISTRKELAAKLNISLTELSSRMIKLYRKAEQEGFKFLTLKYMFYEWVEYIRKEKNNYNV